MEKINLIFVISERNKNSIASLVGALDKAKEIANNFELKFIDEKEILKNIEKEKGIVCFSFQTPDVFKIQDLVKKLKKNKNLTLLAGGTHSSGAYQHTLKMGFDFVFVGEGEESFINFLKVFLSGKNDYHLIKGIVFKNKSQIVFTGKSNPVDITKFLPVSEKLPFFTPIEITRGCPYGCYFCQTTYLFGNVRHRTIKQITESSKILVNHGWNNIRFVSPNILSYGSKNILKPNLLELEKMLSSVRKVRGVKKIYAGSFPSEVRPEMVDYKTMNLLKKYSDNDNIIIGFQSGSDEMLKKMNRRHTTKQALEAIEKAIEVGFKVNVDFVFGLPDETKEDEEQTIKILKKLSKISEIRIHGHIFLPLPGTPWQNKKPTKISNNLRGIIEELEISGKIYGDWKEQEKLAKQITDLKIR
jgi:B12-binding domain/radical SAM domain protein